MKLLMCGLALAFGLFAVPATAQTESLSPLVVSSVFEQFTYVMGGEVQPVSVEHLTNTSQNHTMTMRISVPNQPAWLTGTYSTEELPVYPLTSMGVGISADPTNMAVGTYTTKIIFTGDFSNSPASIEVTLIVLPPAAK